MCGLFISRWVLSAVGKSEGGLDGVVGGMTVIVMLAYTMRLVRRNCRGDTLGHLRNGIICGI